MFSPSAHKIDFLNVLLKPFQNKKGLNNFQVHRFGVFFYSWQLRKRYQKIFGPSYFVTALEFALFS